MTKPITSQSPWVRTAASHWAFLLLVLIALQGLSLSAHALPLFARQTGQNCVACHAGGQFPELTPYGRLFKMTGYTIGERTVPLSAMAVVSQLPRRQHVQERRPRAGLPGRTGSTDPGDGQPLPGRQDHRQPRRLRPVHHDPYASQDTEGHFHGPRRPTTSTCAMPTASSTRGAT